MQKKIEVRCSNGRVYSSIREAAKAANVNEWTMGQKMGVAGSFIDREGNEYFRSRPAQFKNKYKNTGKSMMHECHKSRRSVSLTLPLGDPELPKIDGTIHELVAVKEPLNFDIIGGGDDFTMTIKGLSAQRLAKVIVLLTNEA